MSAPKQPTQRRTMSVRDAAAQLGISAGSAYAAAHKGELPVVKIGERILVVADRFNKMLEGKE